MNDRVTDRTTDRATGEGASFADELGLLMRVIRADGEIRDVEIEALRRIAAARGVSLGTSAELRATIGGTANEAGSGPEARALTRPQRNALVRHMIEIALADGELHEAERDLIRHASERYLTGGAARAA